MVQKKWFPSCRRGAVPGGGMGTTSANHGKMRRKRSEKAWGRPGEGNIPQKQRTFSKEKRLVGDRDGPTGGDRLKYPSLQQKGPV